MKGQIQAVMVPKKWKREKVVAFLERNKFKAELEESAEFWIAVQRPREEFKRVREVRKARGITFRLGYAESAEDPTAPAAAARSWWDNPQWFGDLFKSKGDASCG